MIPKLSIIVPCYNVEKYLDRCIQSLLRQTLDDLEIILVDDGSPDKCPVMCDMYSRQNSNIKVIHKQNEGLGFARNSGLEVATGKYVAFVDSDDFVEPEMYKILYMEAESSHADVVFSNFFIEKRIGQWQNSNEVVSRMEWNGEEVISFMLDMVANVPFKSQERSYQMSVWHSIYRRSIIENHKIRFYSEREVLSEDIPFQMEFLKNARQVVYIPNAFYHYCLNPSSLSHNWNPDKLSRSTTLYKILKRQIGYNIGADIRIDRFYYGYLRNQLLEMYRTTKGNKRRYIRDFCEALINSGLPERYPTQTLSMPKRTLFKLLANRNIMMVSLFCKTVNIAYRIFK